MRLFLFLLPIAIFLACKPDPNPPANKNLTRDTITYTLKQQVKPDSVTRLPAPSDSLCAMASLIGGNWKNDSIYTEVAATSRYKTYAANLSKKWKAFDSSRIQILTRFSETELNKFADTASTLFYPFSGPDYLYPGIFFPSHKKIIMVGLEPVGTFPDFDSVIKDTTGLYFKKLNSSLFAILNFSFFRTESMKKDLKSGELDGTLHLLFLFLNRGGNQIVSARPFTLDTNGVKQYYDGFKTLAMQKLQSKGIEIKFIDSKKNLKELLYFSLDASDYHLKSNKGFTRFANQLRSFTVYLKGASYLLHKSYFSILRNIILQQANGVVQDDSGIAIKYFLGKKDEWSFKLYGQYTRPIALFTGQYQAALDSMYKQDGSQKLDFGLGYNFKDKNSNFMIATRKKPEAGGHD